MSFLALFALSIGLAMDAFAVGICKGLAMERVTLKKAAIVGLYFGVFQAGMPLLGYLAANQFAEMIAAYTHIIAFVLLCILGIKMIAGSLKNSSRTKCKKQSCRQSIESLCPQPEDQSSEQLCSQTGQPPCAEPNGDVSLGLAKMLPLAIATSIDALAVGVSFAFLSVSIIPAVLLIGLTTFVISAFGVKIGNIFGMKFKSKAEIAGGIILILIGTNILLENIIL